MRFAYINPLLPLRCRCLHARGDRLALTVKRNTFIKFYDYWLPPWECVASLYALFRLRRSSIRNPIRFRFPNWNFMHSQWRQSAGEWLEILTRNWSTWWLSGDEPRRDESLESLTICVGNSIYVSEILINLPARRVSLGVCLSHTQLLLPFALHQPLSLSAYLFVCISITSRLMCHKLKAI